LEDYAMEENPTQLSPTVFPLDKCSGAFVTHVVFAGLRAPLQVPYNLE
jgi:hypothetical protein